MAVIRDVMPAFELFQPGSVADAQKLLEQHGPDAWILAGGLDSFDWLKDRKRPKVLVDLSGIEELRGIRTTDGGIEIGACGEFGHLGRGAACDVDRELGEQLVLALDVVVQRGAGDAERVGDVLQARPGEAAFGEQPDRVLVYLVLDEFAACGRGACRLAAVPFWRGRCRAGFPARRVSR